MVKVGWQNHPREEATWETEEHMRRNYPHLFEAPGNSKFRGQNFLKGGRNVTPNVVREYAARKVKLY